MAEIPLWLIAGGLAVVLTLASLAVVARLLLVPRRGDVDPDWLANYSPARYRPMERLLALKDFEFLRSTDGWTPELEEAFRSGRRRLYRRYLRLISRDFGRLHMAARTLALLSPVDRPDLGMVLLREQVAFRKALAGAYLRLAFHPFGYEAGDVRNVLRALESVNSRVRALAVQSAA